MKETSSGDTADERSGTPAAGALSITQRLIEEFFHETLCKLIPGGVLLVVVFQPWIGELRELFGDIPVAQGTALIVTAWVLGALLEAPFVYLIGPLQKAANRPKKSFTKRIAISISTRLVKDYVQPARSHDDFIRYRRSMADIVFFRSIGIVITFQWITCLLELIFLDLDNWYDLFQSYLLPVPAIVACICGWRWSRKMATNTSNSKSTVQPLMHESASAKASS